MTLLIALIDICLSASAAQHGHIAHIVRISISVMNIFIVAVLALSLIH